MIRNGHLVINLKVVGIITVLALLAAVLTAVVGTEVGFFSYNPEVTSVQPVPDVPGAYFVITTEQPGDGAVWFGYEPREGSYIVLPDASVLTYPEMETLSDPGKTEVLTKRLLTSMKRKLVEDVIANRNAQEAEEELITVPQDDD